MSFTSKKYQIAVDRCILDPSDLALEKEADLLLKEAGEGKLTTPAEVDRIRYRERRYEEISLDAISESIADTRTWIDDDPAEDAAAALQSATDQQRAVYILYSQGLMQTDIAKHMNISQQLVSQLLKECSSHIRSWFAAVKGWQLVYEAEVRGKALPVNEIEEDKILQVAVSRLSKQGRNIEPAGSDGDGDPLYTLDFCFELRADQVMTLAALGVVNTHRYGLIK